MTQFNEGAAALVTGGASGIGAAVVNTLATQGHGTVVVDRDPTVATGPGRTGIVADVSDPMAWREIVEVITAQRVRLVVLAAGVNGGDAGPDLDALDDARIAAIVGVNLTGVVLGVRALAPALAAEGGGTIVVIASGAGLEPFDRDPVYSAAKTGAVAFVRAAAGALAERGVTLVAVCPTTAVDTPMLTPAIRERMRASGRHPTAPTVIATAIVDALGTDTPGAVYAVGADGVLNRVGP